MSKAIEGWNVLDEGAGVLWREYPFAKNAYATTMVVRGADGLVVLSPGRGLGARELDALREHGAVRALVANNAMHHMGQNEWRARFPDAESYCPPASVATLTKKTGVPFRSLAELALPAHVRCEDPPGFKGGGETFLQVDAARGPIWFGGDLLANIQRLPGAPLRWLFSLTDSAPGFRLFKLATWVFVKDRRVVREWMLRELDAHPPAIVVPAHGPPVDTADVAEQARAQIQRL